MSRHDTHPRAAKALAALTGRPEEAFTPDFEAYPLPDPDDLECVTVDGPDGDE